MSILLEYPEPVRLIEPLKNLAQKGNSLMNARLARILLVLCLALLGGLLGGCTSTASTLEDNNLAVVRRFYDEYAAGNADVILETHADTVTMHYAGSAEEVSAQVLRDDLADLKEANPDLHAEVHDMVAQGDIVVIDLTWTATHTGDYFGIPATGKTTTHNGIVVRRLKDGKIVESWEAWDDLAFLESIGYVPGWDELVANPPTASK